MYVVVANAAEVDNEEGVIPPRQYGCMLEVYYSPNFLIMKKVKQVPKLVLVEGAFSGGFASLDAVQMDKVRGGKRNPLDANIECNNTSDCTQTHNTGGCTNSGKC